MKYSESIKPISYIKTHLAQIVRKLSESQSPMIITQNGEAKAVVMDIRQYEQMTESMAMLELIAQGKKDLAAGKYRPAVDAFRDLKGRIAKDFG
ncbi:MAG: type II toxin-antitoxin system Phd/YefM family antitoxin [Desulfobacterales bacterium]